MKKTLILLAILAAISTSAYGQGTPPTTWREADGSPQVTPPRTVIVPNGSISGNTVTITGGGGSGCTPPGTANRVLYDNGAGGCTSAAGFTFNGTSTISLGVAGTSVGAIGFRNATSGTVTLSPVAGALGTVTLSLPARTATVATTTGTLTSGRLAEFDASGNLVQSSITATTYAPGGTTNSIQINNGGGVFDGGANAVLDLLTSTLSLGTNSSQSGRLLLRNSTNANTTTLQPGAPSTSLTFTLPATLPASAGCLEVNSSGVITQTGSACGSGGGGSPGGSNTQFQYNNAGSFGGVTGITSDGTNLTAGSGNLRATSPRITTGINDANGNAMLAFSPTGSAVNYFQFTNSATATTAINTLEAAGSDTNISLYLKVKGSDVTNGGQILVDDSRRYDRPMFARKDSPTLGWGFKGGGGWWSVNAANIMLGAGDGTPGLVAITGNSYLAWNVNNTAAEDCPACVAVGLNKPAQRVIGVVGADSTPDGDLTNGATLGFVATTPAQITADQNNYDPTYTSYLQRWSTDASRTVTGLTFAISTKVSGQIHRIWNVGSNNIVLAHQSASSTAANRFLNSTGANITLAANDCADLQYDAADSRWRVTPCATAGAGSGTVTSVAQSFTGGLISVSGSPVTTSGTLALTVAGTSGGIPYFSSASTWASSAALTANLPVIGGGAGAAPSVGTVSGNTTKFVTTTGTLTSGRCAEWDASGNLIQSSGACGGGGGSPGGSTTQIQYNNAGSFGGISTLTTDGTIVTLAATVTTGSGATAGLNATANSLTTGNAFEFSSSSVTSGRVVNVEATGTAAASNTKTAFRAATSGANGTSTQTTYGGRFANTSTGTTSTNIGLETSASGGTVNVGLLITAGNLNWGGTSSSNVMFKPNGTGGAFRRGDDSNLSGSIDAGTFAAGASGAYQAVVDGGNTLNGFSMCSTCTFYLSSSSTATAGLTDLGFTRDSTNTMRVNRGATTGIGFLLHGRAVTAKTADYTVVVNDSNRFFTNTGAAGTVNFTLPTASAGLTYTFYIDASQTLTITAGTSTTIRSGSSVTASAGNITSNTVGNTVRLVAISSTQWVAESIIGTWTFN